MAHTRPRGDIGVDVENNGDEADNAVTDGTADGDTVEMDPKVLRRLVVSTVLDLDADERGETEGRTGDDGALRGVDADKR